MIQFCLKHFREKDEKYGEYLDLDLPSVDRAPISLSFSLLNLVI